MDDEDYGDAPCFSYWAITSSLPDHKLVYRINNALNSNFERSLVDHISHFKGHDFHHTAYAWLDTYNDIQWCILSNRGTSAVSKGQSLDPGLSRALIQQKQPIDFILVAFDEVENEHTREILSTIRKTTGVLYASSLKANAAQLKELTIELENIQI